MDDVYSLLRQVRDFINQPRIKQELFKEKALFYQLCSSLDMAEDSQSAIDSFGKYLRGKPNKGRTYIEIFGLLQALYLQQDAAIDLAESLKFPITIDQYPRLKEIREIRNDAAGHPTKRGAIRGRPPKSWNFIIQHSMSLDSFEVMCWHLPEGHTRIPVKTKEVINDQKAYIVDILQKTYKEIKQRDLELKAKFNVNKITDIFPNTIGYMCEKMGSAIGHIHESTLGEFGATGLQTILMNFEAELKNRNIEITTYPGIELTYTELRYPLEKLQEHFSNSTSLDKEAAYIYVDFVRNKMNELKSMAEELDKEFAETL